MTTIGHVFIPLDRALDGTVPTNDDQAQFESLPVPLALWEPFQQCLSKHLSELTEREIDREEKFWFEAAHVNVVEAEEGATASPELRNRLMSLAAFARRANPTGSNAGLRGALHSIRMRCRIYWSCSRWQLTQRARSRRPICRQRLGLLQDVLHRGVLQVGRIAVFAEQSLHQHPHPGARRLPVHPVDRDVALDARHKLVCNDPQRGFAHDLSRALVLGERVVERDFFVGEPRLLAARPRRPDVLGKLDQFFEHLRRRDGVGVIAGDGRFQPLRERLRLGDVALGLGPHVTIDELSSAPR